MAGFDIGASRTGSTWPARSRRGPQLPLAFEPGTEWLYSVATDVVGRLVEVWSGQPLDEFLRAADLRAAGHGRHRLPVPAAEHDRLAALYAMAPGLTEKIRYDALGEPYKRPPQWFSGGGGLVSTSRRLPAVRADAAR